MILKFLKEIQFFKLPFHRIIFSYSNLPNLKNLPLRIENLYFDLPNIPKNYYIGNFKILM